MNEGIRILYLSRMLNLIFLIPKSSGKERKNVSKSKQIS